MPRPAHPVWTKFHTIVKVGTTGRRAKCKQCNKELQGIPERLLKHVEVCRGPKPRASINEENLEVVEVVDTPANEPVIVEAEDDQAIASTSGTQTPVEKKRRTSDF